MKNVLISMFILLSSAASANCRFHVESNLLEHKRSGDSSFWAINKVMFDKGYTRAVNEADSDIKIDLSVDIKREAKENVLTRVKDLFDRDNESDYVMKFKQTTAIKVTTISGELLSGSLSNSGRTIDNYNNHDEKLAQKSVIDAAKLIDGLPHCGDL